MLRYGFGGLDGGIVSDPAGSGLDGKITNGDGARMQAPSPRKHGVAISLHGADHQWVNVPLRPALDADHWTVSAWVNYTGVENDKPVGRCEVAEKVRGLLAEPSHHRTWSESAASWVAATSRRRVCGNTSTAASRSRPTAGPT